MDEEGHQAVSIGVTGGSGSLGDSQIGAVIAVQTRQKRIETDFFMCNRTLLSYDGRNPMSAILFSVAQAIGGLSPGHIGHHGSSSISDYRSLHEILNSKNKIFSGSQMGTGSDYGISNSKAVLGKRDYDWSSFCGDSPTFPLTASSSSVSFSQLDLVGVYLVPAPRLRGTV